MSRSRAVEVPGSKARALISANDPDAIRAGLAEIADALDAISQPAERKEAA
jgi:hypothetical protein